jgi:carbonyl reductase 1
MSDTYERRPIDQKVGVVLGATRGIGLALGKALAAHWGEAGTVYLSARTEADRAQLEDKLSNWSIGARTVLFDLAAADAPHRVATMLQALHGGVDVVVQNGAYMPRAGVPAIADARPMIATNSHGTLRVLREFLPRLRPEGRMVIVASGLGVLANLPTELRARFDTSTGDPDAINREMDRYVASVEAGTASSEGWPDWVNIPSKVGQVAVTRAFAQWAVQAGTLPEGALINAACPGLTLTDATREFMGTTFPAEDARSPEASAEALLDLATLPSGSVEPYGELVRDGRVLQFGAPSRADQ